MNIGDKVSCFCSGCKGKTFHTVVALHEKKHTPEDSARCNIDWANASFSIQECAGCECVHFEELWITSEDDPDDQAKPTRYPKDGEEKHQSKTFWSAPKRLRALYNEVLDCYNNNSYVLAAAGIRALMEAVCAEMGITDGPVQQAKKGGGIETVRKSDMRGKIEGMREKDVISASHAEAFHQCRFLGNDAVHELERPHAIELKLAIEIVEHTLESVFEIPQKTCQVRDWGKSRKSKAQKK